MIDKETKSKLEFFIHQLNSVDKRICDTEIAFDENFIYLQFEVMGDGVQHVLHTKDFINGRYNMREVYINIRDAILNIISKEYEAKIVRFLNDR